MTIIHHGDCLDVLRTLPDCSVDAVVTDPPAGIAFMGKAWDGNRGGRDQWVSWLAQRLAECLRVLKPGGHAVVWALPRTSGWTHRALEDAGFEVRDCLTHLFGSGFPKSLDVGKAIDKAAGCERKIIGPGRYDQRRPRPPTNGFQQGGWPSPDTAPATDAAREWDGWGTALKPAAEFWYLARKPLAGTVAGNVVEWGTGAFNIDACRVEHGTDVDLTLQQRQQQADTVWGQHNDWLVGKEIPLYKPGGRWPANVALTHHPDCDGGCVDGCPVAELNRQSGTLAGSKPGTVYKTPRRPNEIYNGGGWHDGVENQQEFGYGDVGGASRYFSTFRYQAKPSTREKNGGLDDIPAQTRERTDEWRLVENATAKSGINGALPRKNQHPTVKPVELMRWLIRLVTPPGGVVLDPFTGSGTTLVAATLEGFDSIGIEREAEYLPIIEGRIRWAEQQQAEPRQLALGEGGL